MPVTCGFGAWRDAPQLNRQAPSLTVADRCIWHDSGTNLSRRQPATTAGALADQARVCPAAPPRASATLPLPSTGASRDDRPVTTVPKPATWELRALWGGLCADLGEI